MNSKETLGNGDSAFSLTLEAPKKKGRSKPAPSKASSPAEPGGDDRLYGVFSTETVSTVGTGATKRKETKRALWFAEEIAPNNDGERIMAVRPINNKNVPYGDKQTIPLDEFLRDYYSEIEYYQTVVFPKMKELDALLDRAEEQRGGGELYSAQFGFEAALEFDEKNVRANFGLGLTYMARGDREKAANIFKRLVTLDAAFSEEHKHLFNEFGINLRKSRLFDQAVVYYARALEMTTDDENLYYNMARALYQRGDKGNCRETLEKALALNPGLREAKELMDYLNKREQGSDEPRD